MHKVDSRTYIGQPNETVSLTTQLGGGGQISVVVDGQDLGGGRRFPLPPDPGDRVKLQIMLVGPLGATCVVSISTVDGASDGDFLMCQAHNPAPVNFYTCSVAQPSALTAFAKLKSRAGAKRKRSGPR